MDTPRLLEAAREFNIGKETLVEFLNDEGFSIVDKPSERLTGKMYNALKVNFAKDKLAKLSSEKNEIINIDNRKALSEVLAKLKQEETLQNIEATKEKGKITKLQIRKKLDFAAQLREEEIIEEALKQRAQVKVRRVKTNLKKKEKKNKRLPEIQSLEKPKINNKTTINQVKRKESVKEDNQTINAFVKNEEKHFNETPPKSAGLIAIDDDLIGNNLDSKLISEDEKEENAIIEYFNKKIIKRRNTV